MCANVHLGKLIGNNFRKGSFELKLRNLSSFGKSIELILRFCKNSPTIHPQAFLINRGENQWCSSLRGQSCWQSGGAAPCRPLTAGMTDQTLQLSPGCRNQTRVSLRWDSHTLLYRATHHLDSYILLTSNWKLRGPVWAVGSYSSGPPAGGTLVLMSTEYRNQGDVSPCSFTCEAKV